MTCILTCCGRYALNYKGLDYKTQWVDFPDIESECKKLGIEASGTRADGSPYYSLPAIYDSSTGTYVSESFKIALYLEKAYPNTPALFPHNTAALQAGFVSAFEDSLNPLWDFILPALVPVLTTRGEEYFRRTREKSYGKKLEDVVPQGAEGVAQWKQFEQNLNKANGWYEKAGKSGGLVLGDTVSLVDTIVAGYLIFLKLVWGEGSREWKDISSWNGGRWARVVSALGEYEQLK